MPYRRGGFARCVTPIMHIMSVHFPFELQRQRVVDHDVQVSFPMSCLAIVPKTATNRALLRDRVRPWWKVSIVSELTFRRASRDGALLFEVMSNAPHVLPNLGTD